MKLSVAKLQDVFNFYIVTWRTAGIPADMLVFIIA